MGAARENATRNDPQGSVLGSLGYDAPRLTRCGGSAAMSHQGDPPHASTGASEAHL